ncbi:MAG: type II secretion system F family protein [Thermoguttaceae bacterium]|jgi:tight adherence protein B
MNPTALAFVIYAGVGLTVAAVLMVFRDLAIRRRLARGEAAEGPETSRRLGPILPPAEMAAAELRGESRLAQLVAETGSDFTPDTLVLMAIAAGLALGGAMFLWRNDWLAGAAGAVVGAMAVAIVLFFLRFRRRRAIRDQLPDAMEMMARAVRAGESLDQAIALVGNSAFRPVAAEFRSCASQMRMGLSLEAAVRNLVRRVPLPETRILAMIFIVQRRRGGNLPVTLERLARVFRDHANFYRQFWTSTAVGRGSAILIAVIALGLDLAVILWHPDYARKLLETDPGRIMLAAALALQVVGISWAVWLFRSDY